MSDDLPALFAAFPLSVEVSLTRRAGLTGSGWVADLYRPYPWLRESFNGETAGEALGKALAWWHRVPQ